MEIRYEYDDITLCSSLFPTGIDDTSGKRYPLLVWMGREEDECEKHNFNNIKKICEEKNFHLLCLNYEVGHLSTSGKVCKAIQKFLFQIRSEWKMDVCRTYIAGFREGAYWTWKMVSAYPRLFAAAFCVHGYGDPYKVRHAKEVPIWAVHFSHDQKLSPLERKLQKEGNILAGSQLMVQSLRNVGGQPRYTLLPGEGKEALSEELLSQAVEWMQMQDRRNIFRVERIVSGVWRIDDYFMASCYLIEGPDRALLIDTGMGTGDFNGLIRSLTSKPITLAITHPHVDHMFHASLFSEVYLYKDAIPNYNMFYKQMETEDYSRFENLYGVKIPKRGQEKIFPLEDGQDISLGDGCQITAVWLPGHTSYDCVFIDDLHQCVFTGDAVGSGDTVGIPTSRESIRETIRKYRNSLDHFLRQQERRIQEYAFLGGHFIQENSCDDTMQEDWINGQSAMFRPLSLQVVLDMRTLCDKILEGKFLINEKEKNYSFSWGEARLSGTFW